MTMSFMEALGVAVVGSVLTSIFGLFFNAISPGTWRFFSIKYSSVFFRLLLRGDVTLGAVGIGGTWNTQYHKDLSPGTKHEQTICLYQLGKAIAGSGHYPSDKYKRIRVIGKIVNDKYFEGSYIDTKGSAKHNGTFQLALVKHDHSAKTDCFTEKMQGRWIGFSNTDSDIIHGDWIWLK